MDVLSIIADTSFIWLPVVLFSAARQAYLKYKFQSYRADKLSFDNYTMLEINIPKEIHRSPKAMEFIIDVLHHRGGGAGDWKHRYWYGAVYWPSSLEIVSIEGNIYFFIRVHEKLAPLIKSAIYSQFPQVEVNEVDDYTKYVPNYNYNSDSWEVYGADFGLAEEDFLPIKTYVDYELDTSVGKLEEFEKIDPLTPMIEFLSTLGPGEQIWIQYIIRADAKSGWRKQAQKYIADMMNKTPTVDEGQPFQMLKLTYGEQEQIKGIERSLSKHAFETIIRAVYIAKKDKVNPGVKGFFKNPIFKPFSSFNHNSIKKINDTGFDWVWEDMSGKRDEAQKRKFFTDYVNRDGFDRAGWSRLNSVWNNDEKVSVLTSEELATLFHFPGAVSETRSFERIDATKSQAPQNLPI